MYSVVIVDDEEHIRRAMIEKVDWSNAGFEIIGDAENGIDALELVEQHEPDLLITDIKMPLMGGLELAAKVREICPATQIVILSGYDDFQYAQTAITYNIISYLLKPISAEEMFTELCKIKLRMDERFNEIRGTAHLDYDAVVHRLETTQFLLPLLLGTSEDTPDDEVIADRAQQLGITESGKKTEFIVLVSKFRNDHGSSCTNPKHIEFVNAILHRYMKAESFFVNGRIVTLGILCAADEMEQMQFLLRELVQSASKVLNQKCTVGVSRKIATLSQCSGAYFDAVTARRYTSDGSGEVRFIADQEHGAGCEFEYVEKSVFTLEQLLKVGTKDRIREFFDSLYNEENKNSLDYLVIQILATVYRTVSAVSDNKALPELIASNPIYAKATFYDYEQNVKEDLTELCSDAREIIARYQKQDTEKLCDRVIQIIESDFGDEKLSLTGVSSQLNVSPNYLSALIKKKKKVNFINLLTEKRMKVANDMLVCSNMKILEIAQRCGYNDQHYFSYCFKKYYGVSPIKMRESSRGE